MEVKIRVHKEVLKEKTRKKSPGLNLYREAQTRRESMVQEGLVEEDVVICCKLIVHETDHFKACLPTRLDAANHIPNGWILPTNKTKL